MPIDLTPLASGIARLEEGQARYLGDTSDTQIRDGLIQRFGFTYDLAHKMLRRFLAMSDANPDAVAQMSFPTLIRTANERGLLLNEWSRWRQYRDDRNITSHTYDETKAIRVVAGIPAFIEEVRYLHDTMTQRAE
ncbi:HI0074 family nucleotidyltransferase substrate-binding subunit [Sphingomonas aracearum]|uniref:HI0074 family nucleotidyltransferase substrate-binding subunit n=1 Tax=Sphingomonas aracearum TaxID=2283317 RepID=UPI001EF0BD13|nr:HI0074 family nucleotidyltransferase substrate-binding subunit [Sphingomonas aracearum]